MKKVLIALLALTITLGVACKKEEGFEVKKKIENSRATDEEDDGLWPIGENPFDGHRGIKKTSVHEPIRGVCLGNSVGGALGGWCLPYYF